METKRNPLGLNIGDKVYECRESINSKHIHTKMFQVYQLAQKSTDKSTKNGALICQEGWNVAIGFNHHIYGFGDKLEHHERPLKYEITEHAERDAIFNAIRKGVDIRGLTLVANWVACPDCARAIVLSDIKDVICHKECMDRTPERWKERVDLGLKILKEGSVDVYQWSGTVGGVKALMNGEIWYP